MSPSERARQQQIDDDDGDDDNDDVGDDGDIYIMMKCVCVSLTKNHHFRAERQRGGISGDAKLINISLSYKSFERV